MKLKYIYGIVVLFTSWIATAQTFQDNVTNETIGDFPSQWDIVGGMATVNQQDGYKYIGFRSGGIIKPIVNNQTNNYLNGDFTVEFDVFFDKTSSLYGQGFQLRLWDGAYGYEKNGIRYKPFMIYRDGLETDWNHPEMGSAKNHLKEFQTLEPVWRHAKVECIKGKLKVLLDDQMVLFLPRFKMQPTMVSIGGAVNDSRFDANIGFTNFTITNILPQTEVVMLVDKETDAVIDINLLSNIKNNTALQESYSNTVAYLGSITGNYKLRPVDLADVKKPINVDVDAYGKYKVMPAKEAQLVFDFDTKYETKKLGITPTQTIVANQQSWLGNYFESNTTLPLTFHELVLENGTLKLIGETEKNLSASSVNDDGPCSAKPTEEQLRILADSTSLYNQRLQYIKNYSFDQLRGLPSVEYLNNLSINQLSLSSKSDFSTIPTAVHIVRKSDKTGGISRKELIESFKRANNLLEPYGLYVHINNLNYIDDTTVLNTKLNDSTDANGNGHADYLEILDIPDRDLDYVLNIYFTENSYTSWARFPNKGYENQHILMRNGQAKNASTLTHELGHWFSLLHTHETARGDERVDGKNCKSSGDLCCDTPADPNLSGLVTNCVYTGTETDSKNTDYKPDTSNIMSYSEAECRNNFTDEQIARIYSAYLGMKNDRGYNFKINRKIGQELESINYNAGWAAREAFELGPNKFMIYFNDLNNAIAIYSVDKNGKTGSQVAYKEFRGNISFIGINNISTKSYALFMDYGTGQLGIIKLNDNGSLGSAQAYQLPTNYTNAYITAYPKRFLMLKSNSGTITTYSLESDGRLGSKLQESQLNFNNLELLSFGNYTFGYNKSDGFIRKLIIKSDGRIGIDTATRKDIGGQWNVICNVAQTDSKNDSMTSIMALNSNTGQLMQYGFEDGKILDDWYDSYKLSANFTSGFDYLTPYYIINNGRLHYYVTISNSEKGEVKTYYLNNYMQN